MDIASRDSEDANTGDIVTAAIVVALKTPPCVMSNAQDIVRLPKYYPADLLEPSLTERLAVVESQLRQLNDSVSTNTEKCLRMKSDLITLTKMPRPPQSVLRRNTEGCNWRAAKETGCETTTGQHRSCAKTSDEKSGIWDCETSYERVIGR